MDISNNTNISAQIASSISKLNLNTAKRAFEVQKNDENTSNIELQDFKKSDIQLIEDKKVEQNWKLKNVKTLTLKKTCAHLCINNFKICSKNKTKE